MSTLDAVKAWTENHPILFPLILFFLSSLVSIYSGTIKRFVAIPPQKLGIMILQTRIGGVREALDSLEKCQNNPYELLRRILLRIVMTLAELILLVFMALVAILSIDAHVLGYHLPGEIKRGYVFWATTTQMGVAVLAGVMVSRLLKAANLLRGLGNFSKERAALVERIAALEARLHVYSSRT